MYRILINFKTNPQSRQFNNLSKTLNLSDTIGIYSQINNSYITTNNLRMSEQLKSKSQFSVLIYKLLKEKWIILQIPSFCSHSQVLIT